VWETREAKGRGALEEEGQLHRRDGDRDLTVETRGLSIGLGIYTIQIRDRNAS
jgi:hypothetical protein